MSAVLPYSSRPSTSAPSSSADSACSRAQHGKQCKRHGSTTPAAAHGTVWLLTSSTRLFRVALIRVSVSA